MMPVEIRYDEVRQALLEVHIPLPVIRLSDASYALPTARWVQEDFSRTYTAMLGDLGYDYVAEMRDCDDHTRWAAAWAGFFHAETVKAQRLNIESGLAFGELWLGGMKRHAVNVALHWDESVRKPIVAAYDPQPTRGEEGGSLVSFRPYPLTEEDYQSCVLCLL